MNTTQPALQCCLVCGRTLTDRELHDELEGRVLAAIRAEHPEWAEGDEACGPCVAHYRRGAWRARSVCASCRVGGDRNG